MGMAASQARLLSITARIHDVEYQAQSIQNAKVQLATQSDQVYNEYLEALDAQLLTLATSNNATIAANFNNLFSSNRVTSADGKSYVLRNDRGQVVVEDEVYEAYQQFKQNDAYAFAAYMLGGNAADTGSLEDGSHTKTVHEHEELVYQHYLTTEDEKSKLDENSQLVKLHKSLEKMVSPSDDIYDSSNVSEDKIKEYNDLLTEYRNTLYSRGNYAKEICVGNAEWWHQSGAYKLMSESEFDLDKFNYYVEIFNTIRTCGGCVPISDYNGMFGDAKNNGEWLTSMVQSGKFTIDTVTKDKNGKYTMNGTSPGSDSSLSYSNVSTVDNTAVKKAEAKYEHDLKDIDKKDKKYDLTLSKLETERTALTTEYESVKKVIEDNIDRTFGIFS